MHEVTILQLGVTRTQGIELKGHIILYSFQITEVN